MPIAAAAQDAEIASPTSFWTADDVARIGDTRAFEAPLITAADVHEIVPGLDLWDVWPLQLDDGSVAQIAGGSLWMILSAPRFPDPNGRHDVARTRLLHKLGGAWHDCGNLFPDGLNPGTREWSGSALFDPATMRVTAFFTATGRAGEAVSSFEQRLFQTAGTLDPSGAMPRVEGWSAPTELVHNNGAIYADLAVDQGVPGHIKGFRDPFWFRDPADGSVWLLFTGSLADSVSEHSGVIGIAAARGELGASRFDLLPPIVSADGLVNEMERPHMIVRDGLYYLFWSSQRSVFASSGPCGPTGLYGMVARSLRGPFEPLNGTGLVITNPVAEPLQAYCWQVLDTLEVISFVDYWGLNGRDRAADPHLNRAQFGGTIAPMLRIELDGNATRLTGLA